MTAPRVCSNHADRPAFAVCMTCRKSLCQECATTWDGIHYCAGCLAQRRQGGRAGIHWIGWIAVGTASLGLAYAHQHVIVWLGVFLAGLR
jgi:hypothetical protein